MKGEKRTWSLSPYNGFSPDERRATLPVQRAAILAGKMPKPSQCSICGFTSESDPASNNRVTLHDENYDRTLEAYPVCRHCHRTLHARFNRPNPWLRLITQYGTGLTWFEQLTMDEESQRRPFHETYPRGLPPPEKTSWRSRL
jgi:hypothetical protein